jgi:uncharacterized protein (TIGR02246 family)
MRRAIVITLAAALAASAPALADTKPKAPTAAEAKAAIEAANAKFGEAYGKGDTTAVAALYTEDAMALPPGHDSVKGRKAIGEFWAQTRKDGVKGVKLETLDVGAAGDMAYETGMATLTIEAEGKPPATAKAKYVVVWKRQGDGGWQLHRDIWNDMPAAK